MERGESASLATREAEEEREEDDDQKAGQKKKESGEFVKEKGKTQLRERTTARSSLHEV